jgi:hypothetical protein
MDFDFWSPGAGLMICNSLQLKFIRNQRLRVDLGTSLRRARWSFDKKTLCWPHISSVILLFSQPYKIRVRLVLSWHRIKTMMNQSCQTKRMVKQSTAS